MAAMQGPLTLNPWRLITVHWITTKANAIIRKECGPMLSKEETLKLDAELKRIIATVRNANISFKVAAFWVMQAVSQAYHVKVIDLEADKPLPKSEYIN